jgi:hypothetical protein
MIKILNLNEMMQVNGGFKYIPVYVVKRYYAPNGRLIGMSNKKFIGLEQVASNDSRTQIIKFI